MSLPQAFWDRYQPIAPDDFAVRLQAGLPKTIRVNTLKTSVAEFRRRAARQGWQLTQLPANPAGFIIDRRERSIPLGHSLEHLAGHCYIQQASSQLPPLALDPQPGERVLDLAAAPGSKTTQIAALMANRGVVVANDSSVRRLKSLTANLERSGIINTVVTQLSGPRLGRLVPDYFDRVLIDAPCTAEGTLAKNFELAGRWSVAGSAKLATLQSKLLAGSYHALRPGGCLVYSTCTFAPEENEAVVSAFLAHHPEAEVQPIRLPGVPARPGLTEWQGRRFDARLDQALRIWPEGTYEGFFMVKLGKPATAGLSSAGRREYSDRRYQIGNDSPAGWLEKTYGLPATAFSDMAWRTKDADAWIMTPEAAEFNHVPAVRRGLRVARQLRGGWKPTTDWLQLAGPTISRQVVDTTDQETSRYLAGENLARSDAAGYVALRNREIIYACGLGQPDRIKNQLAVSRRIISG